MDSSIKKTKFQTLVNNVKKLTVMEVPELVDMTDRNNVPLFHPSMIGEYMVGPTLGISILTLINEYIARKDGTSDFYKLKVFSMLEPIKYTSLDELKGRVLMDTEYLITSMLKGVEGVGQTYGLYLTKLDDWTTVSKDDGHVMKLKPHLCLVLDYFAPRNSCPTITIKKYVLIKNGKLAEAAAIRIFLKALHIIERIHNLNIVHCDISLNNFLLDMSTDELTLINFCLSRHVRSTDTYITGRAGSAAYTAPEALDGNQYLGKPRDMWAAGIMLYAMLYGHFPFYDKEAVALYCKTRIGKFIIPPRIKVSKDTVQVITSLLEMNPKARLTASEAINKINEIIIKTEEYSPIVTEPSFHMVPEYQPGKVKRVTRKPPPTTFTTPQSGQFSVDAASTLSMAINQLNAHPTLPIPGIYTPLTTADGQNLVTLIKETASNK